MNQQHDSKLLTNKLYLFKVNNKITYIKKTQIALLRTLWSPRNAVFQNAQTNSSFLTTIFQLLVKVFKKIVELLLLQSMHSNPRLVFIKKTISCSYPWWDHHKHTFCRAEPSSIFHI